MKLFLILLLLAGLQSYAQLEGMYKVRLELENRQYDSLYLQLRIDEFNGDHRFEFFSGHSTDGYNWDFFYPDSLYGRIFSSSIIVAGTPDSVNHIFVFKLALQGDTILCASVLFERPTTLVKGRYDGTETHPNVRILRRGTMELIHGTNIGDFFEFSTDDQNLILSMKSVHYGYGFFHHSRSARLSYEGIMQRDMDFIRQNPNFLGMMSALYSNKALYRSKDDIAKKFNLFSNELQQSLYGREIYKHIARIDTVFKNQMLPVWNADKHELIIQDSSKFNLILFSASWCAPCIRQIPDLKGIYQDLGRNLIMTYVSLDHERGAENWRKKMHTHEIPWRSLIVWTEAKEKQMRGDYEVFGVPHAILVHPGTMKMERLDFWEAEHRQRLYELVK